MLPTAGITRLSRAGAATQPSGSDSSATPSDISAAADRALDAAANYQKIKQQQQQYQSQQLVEKALKEQAANQKRQALDDFSRAAELDPSNQQAIAGRDELADQLGVGNRPSGLQQQATVLPERIQAIQYSFDSAVQEANSDIQAGDFQGARRAIDRARIARNTDPTIFTQQQINVFDQTIANTEAGLERAELQKSEQDANKAASDAEVAQAKAAAQAQQDRERTVAGLIQDARVYIDQGKYREALAVIDHIQALDPTNQYASNVRLLIEDKAALQEQRSYKEEFNRQLTSQFNRSQEELIPYSDILRYPNDWPQISQMRDEEVAEERGENSEDATLQAALDKHLEKVTFNANSFADVIDYLRDQTGTNIYVDWAALERASISRDAPVTTRLRDIKFSKALELIFKSVEGEQEDQKLGYSIDEGVITISTRKDLNRNVVVERYDINDLLFVAPDYTNAPTLDLTQNNSGTAGGGGGGGGGASSNLFQNANTNNNQEQQQGQRQQRIDEIHKYIVDNVDSASWKENGGDVGSISSSPLRAVLLITQTPENQHEINKVLDSLRASQALQVSIEVRFLTVQRNYLEDIGVNANFTFNPNNYWSSHFSPIVLNQSAVSSNNVIFDANGNPVSNATNSQGLNWVSEVANATVPGSIAANPADYPNPSVIAGSYIDNMTVNFLIRAVEANVNTTSLTAPRLTLFSGQRAVIVISTQEAYVSGLTPVVATGAALFEPTISTVNTGISMSVLATVSPDRKYVYLDLTPQLGRLIALVPLTESSIVTPVTTGVGVTTTAPEIISGTLQLPTLEYDIIETSCAVPDGATLLLGGQTLAGETSREQGVPILSKIPFLKRLFTNRASSQDEQVLLILVKPTILIQHEQEQKQFPTLSTKVNG